jgi:hypothetical protein
MTLPGTSSVFQQCRTDDRIDGRTVSQLQYSTPVLPVLDRLRSPKCPCGKSDLALAFNLFVFSVRHLCVGDVLVVLYHYKYSAKLLIRTCMT